MRIILLYLLLLFPEFASADARFDSLFARSEVIVYGQVLYHEISPVQNDLGTIYCWMDVWITQICTGGKSTQGESLQFHAGDTIKHLFYYGGYVHLGDTLSKRMAYVIPLTHDSEATCGWKLTDPDATYGTFVDLSMMTNHCPVKYVVSGKQIFRQEQTHDGKWYGYNLYYPDGQLKEVYTQRGNRKKNVEKRTEYSESGNRVRKTRTITKYIGWGSRTVQWTFVENGKFKLRRQKWRAIL